MHEARLRRKNRVRAAISGTTERPRLSVFRSTGHIYAQVIDDTKGATLAAASDADLDKKDLKGDDTRKAKVAIAFAVGKMVAERAIKKGINTIVFDRNGFAYSGRIAALADGAREGGLTF